MDPAGDLYIADGANNRIRENASSSGVQWEALMTASDIYTIAGTGTASDTGNGSPAFPATVYFAISSGTDNHGDPYIGDQYGGQLREIPPPPPPSHPHPT